MTFGRPLQYRWMDVYKIWFHCNPLPAFGLMRDKFPLLSLDLFTKKQKVDKNWASHARVYVQSCVEIECSRAKCIRCACRAVVAAGVCLRSCAKICLLKYGFCGIIYLSSTRSDLSSDQSLNLNWQIPQVNCKLLTFRCVCFSESRFKISAWFFFLFTWLFIE